jgi:hypothetical protein
MVALFFYDVFAIVRFELRQLVRDFPDIPAFVAVLESEKLLRHARRAHFSVNVVVVRHPVTGFSFPPDSTAAPQAPCRIILFIYSIDNLRN